MFPAEPIPDAIGSYKILRRLPGGGAAELYLAKAQGPMGFERECELKLMPDTSDGDASYAEELAREAAICAKLNNPAVVRVFDFFEHHGKLVLALEHVDGVLLADLLNYLSEQHQKLADAAVYHIGARIAGALGDAHAAKDERGEPTPIIHRNISPETVLVATDGDVRLTGFGVGKILGRTPDTAIGRIKGTPGYMAPEQARGEPVTTKADVYGLGLLLWSLLSGKRPPMDGTWPRRVTGLRNDLPREVAAMVDAALDHFPGTRKITAREIEQWLGKAAPAQKGKNELRTAVTAMRAATKDQEPPPPSSRRRITTAGGPYKGVSFGPAGSKPPSTAPAAATRSTAPVAATRGSSAPAAATRGSSAPAAAVRPSAAPAAGMTANDLHDQPRSRTGAPARTATATGMGGTVVLNLPPPPSIEEPPDAEHTVRFGTPPPGMPSPPPMPAGPPVDASAAKQQTALLAPVMPLAPTPAPAAVEPPPTSVRYIVQQVPVGTPVPGGTRPAREMMETLAPGGSPLLVMPDQPSRRVALPSLLTLGPGRRSLSAFGAIVVSAVTATVVVMVALFFRRDHETPAAVEPTVAPAPTAPPVPPAPTATAAPTSTVAASGSADPTTLPLGYGYLTIVSPAEANVYLSGKLLGPVNRAIRVRCGRWFIRLAAPQEGRYPEWVTTGETVLVPCQESVRLDMNPRRL
jgi:serine/threonine-protein kinase